jgi:hypothetical protein
MVIQKKRLKRKSAIRPIYLVWLKKNMPVALLLFRGKYERQCFWECVYKKFSKNYTFEETKKLLGDKIEVYPGELCC